MTNNRTEIATALRELTHETYYNEEIVDNICDAINIADQRTHFVHQKISTICSPTSLTQHATLSALKQPQKAPKNGSLIGSGNAQIVVKI